MKSVGEVMAIGRTFKEALNKALRGLEIGLGLEGAGRGQGGREAASGDLNICRRPTAGCNDVRAAPVRRGRPRRPCGASRYDPWFVSELADR